jgi:hypothetical protein
MVFKGGEPPQQGQPRCSCALSCVALHTFICSLEFPILHFDWLEQHVLVSTILLKVMWQCECHSSAVFSAASFLSITNDSDITRRLRVFCLSRMMLTIRDAAGIVEKPWTNADQRKQEVATLNDLHMVNDRRKGWIEVISSYDQQNIHPSECSHGGVHV